jgi:hypothetical protein
MLICIIGAMVAFHALLCIWVCAALLRFQLGDRDFLSG